MYCKNCGHELEPNAYFCGECGATITNLNPEEKSTEELQKLKENIEGNSQAKAIPSSYQNNIKKKKSKSKLKSIILLVAITILVGGGYVGIKYLQQLYSPEKVIENFKRAIETQDIDMLKDVFSDEYTAIDEKELKWIIDYYQGNEKTLSTDIKQLKENFENNKISDLPYYLSCEEGQLFDKCSIKVIERELTIKTSLENVNIALYSNNELIQDNIDLNKSISNLEPGFYELKVTSTNELTPFTFTEEVNLFKSHSHVEVILDGDINENKINSSEDKAIIYINGESTGKTASELGTLFGLEDGTEVYGLLTLENQEVKSNTVVVSGSQPINLEFDYVVLPTTSEAEIQVESLMSQYLTNFEYAVYYNAFSYIRPYIYVGSELYDMQKSYIQTRFEQGVVVVYLSHTILKIDYDEKEKTGTVRVEESYGVGPRDSEYHISTYESVYEFIFNEDDEKFYLTKITLI